MEFKALVPQSGSSSYIPIRASPSYDSDIETNGLNFDSNKDKDNNTSSSISSISCSSISGSEDEDGGFVSGEEEFEVSLERPFVAENVENSMEKDVVDDDFDENYVEAVDGRSVEFSNTGMPIAKVSFDDDDEDDDDENAVESPKVRVFEAEEIGELGGGFGATGDLDSGSVVSGVNINAGAGAVVCSEVVESSLGEQVKCSDLGGIQEATGLKLVLEGEDIGSLDEAITTNMVAEIKVAERSDSGHFEEASGLKLILEEDMVAESEVAEKSDIGGIKEAAAEKMVVEEVLSKQVKPISSELVKESGGGGKLVAEAGLDEQVNSKLNSREVLEERVIVRIEEARVEKLVVEVDLDEQVESYLNEVERNDGGIEEASVEEPIVDTVLDEQVKLSEVVETSEIDAVDNDISEKLAIQAGVDESQVKSTVAEYVNLTSEGDSIVKKINVDLSEPGVVVVADLIENKDSVMEEVGVPIDVASTMENGFDLIAHDGEVPAELKDVNEDTDPGASAKDEQNNVEVDAFNGEEELKSVFEQGTDAEQNESMVKLAADEEIISSSRDIGSNAGEVTGVDAIAQSTDKESEIFSEAEDEISQLLDQDGEIDRDSDTEGMIFGSSEAARKFMEELEQGSGVESSHELSQRIDGRIVTDSDVEVDTDEEGEGKELFDSSALAALFKAATGAGSDGGNIATTSQDGSRLFSVERPAGLGPSLRSFKPAPRQNGSNLFTPSQFNSTGRDSKSSLSEEEKKKLEMIQQLRVKFLRIVQRLGHSFEDSVAAQVLYRLALIAGRPTSPLFSLEVAKDTATALESGEKANLDISLNILVLGKAGVGKSATINSIFGEEKTSIDAFELSTTSVKEIAGLVDGVKVRVFDTPGLKSSFMEQAANQKILSQIKKVTKKCPPDIVLYMDRLDTQTRDLNDLPLLRTITASLGPSIWRCAIVTLTHGASAPPDGPSGQPLSYEVFVAQRSHVVQQSIGQAVGDLRLMNPSLMNPVSLVENHRSCRKNRDGQKVLPNGQTWRPQLLLLCYSMKILSEASSLSKPQDSFDHHKLFGFRTRSPPLPYLLSWLLQSRTHPKLPSDQGTDIGDSDIDLDDLSDSDVENRDDEYDQLPPFKPLKKSQFDKLNKEQRKAYLEEYDYRVKLLQKKQWREELKRMRESKRGKVGGDEYGYNGEDMEQEDGGPAAVPVALPDMALPPSFDSDNPAYRYRFLEPTSQLMMRPVLDTHGWDHDCGYDGVNLEQSLAIASRFPAAVTVQITKDKKEFNIHLDSSVAAKHGENNSSMAGFDIQNVGKQLAYILRGETKFKAVKRNTTSAGFSVTFLGENIATGIKLEDQLTLGKRLVLVGSTGTVRSQSDAAYGANLEVRLRESDFPIGQDQSTLGLSLVKWRGDLALGANLQSQFSIGRSSKMAVRVGLNNKLSGQITVRTTSSDQLQIGLMGVLPIAMTIYKSLWPSVGENNPIY